MKHTYIACLQQELVQVFGHPVLTASDCSKLAEDIFERTGSKISVNTLRRFFGLIAAKYPPSYNSLTILSNACGFHSFAEFTNTCERKKLPANDLNLPLLKFMVLLFRQTPVANNQDETFSAMVRLTITYLLNNEDIVEAFQKEIARTKNGQDFYFERFIHTDYLARFYGDGLRYYLNEKKEGEAQLFGHSLLCFRYWLSNEDRAFELHYKHIERYASVQRMSPDTQARYFSTKLFHAHIHKLPATSVLDEARSAFIQISQVKEYIRNVASFEFLFSAALVLTHHYDEALFYLGSMSKRKVKHALTEQEIGQLTNAEVFEALSLAGLGKMGKARTLYVRLKGVKFNFLDRKYMSILFMHVEQVLKRKNFRAEKLDLLVQDTGFLRLKDLFTIR